MRIRILLFEDEHAVRRPLSNFLRSKGHEVLEFPSPLSCTLMADKQCDCTRDHACADMMITDMKMPEMTGLELIRMMKERSCHTPPKNKVVITSSLTPEQSMEIQNLGCHFLPKPFHFEDIFSLVEDCEKNVPPDRKLASVEEIWDTIRNSQ